MSKVNLILGEIPNTCDECPLFVRILGQSAFCTLGAEYTADEILAEEDGNLDMYYHGCLSQRPKECPLKAEPKQEPKTDLLDKIRAEIEMKKLEDSPNFCIKAHNHAIESILQIIDKYMTESEDKE